MQARELMTSDQIWACADNSDARECAQMMRDHNVGAIPVLDQEGKLEGILTDRDICCRLVAEGRTMETPVRDLMTKEPQFVKPDTDLQDCERMMRENKIRRLPVVNDEMKLQGFISTADIARKRESKEIAEVMETISRP
ncbi:MAG: CBS domain-containing protein [Planctomycetota bacterium]